MTGNNPIGDHLLGVCGRMIRLKKWLYGSSASFDRPCWFSSGLFPDIWLAVILQMVFMFLCCY